MKGIVLFLLVAATSAWDYTEFVGGCCSGKNELGQDSSLYAYTDDTRPDRIARCSAHCDGISDCVSFELHPQNVATPGCWFSTSCIANEGGSSCGHDLYIKERPCSKICKVLSNDHSSGVTGKYFK